MNTVKFFTPTILLIICFIHGNYGEYLISRSDMIHACEMSAKLLKQGTDEKQSQVIVINKLLQFNRAKKPGKPGKPSLGYGYCGYFRGSKCMWPEPVTQTGPFNLNADSIFDIIISIMSRGIQAQCGFIEGFCPFLPLPDQIDFEDRKQIDSVIKKLKVMEKHINNQCKKDANKLSSY